jgi:hypothetical protein
MKKVAITMALMMMFVFAAGFTGLAAQQAPTMKKFICEVVKIDTKAGTITVKFGANKEKTLEAEAKMLEGIEVGDKVEIEKEGKVVKSIKKVETPTPAAPTSVPPAQK